MAKIEPNVLREAQLIMLDMLKEFDTICKGHNLQYWLDSGTLLGAIRHKGFIPWDDDIDISMPVEDYNKFLKIAQNQFSKEVFVQTKESDPNFLFDYIKLRSNRGKIVEFHEKDREIKYHQGLFVDIFPMLTLPNSSYYKEFYDNIFKLIRQVSAKSLHTPNGIDHQKTREKLQDALEHMHQGWRDDSLKIIYSGKMPDVSAWFDYDTIFPLKEVEFEGINFKAPNNPQQYLKEIYSFDFMQLPPPDKRATHAWSVEIN